MNSSPDAQEIRHVQRTTKILRLFSLVPIVLINYLGVPMLCMVIIMIAYSVAAKLVPYSTSNVYLDKVFVSVIYGLAPIWVLIVDPCAVGFAHSLTLVNSLMVVIFQKSNHVRLALSGLMVISWIFVSIAEGILISECTKPVTQLFKSDCVIMAIMFAIMIPSSMAHIDAIMKETKTALSQVKELNEKTEKLNSELKGMLDDKDNFIFLFSHETRNPLNILLGNLTLLLDEVDSPQIKSRVEKCKFCADLLLQHLNNILDTGKLANSGSLEVTPIPVRSNEYLQSIKSFMEMLVKKKADVKSELIVPECLPTMLRFDMQRLTQVCLNLLTNALKFTDSGWISMVIRYIRKNELQESDYYPSTDFGYQLLISSEEASPGSMSGIGEELVRSTKVRYKRQFVREIANLENKKKHFTGVNRPEKGFLKIEINDTGCGIKREDINKLFKKFSQAHSDAAQLQVGSGLGLWITRTLCELMGGDVRVYSQPNAGSCFVAIIQADCLPSPRARHVSSHFLRTEPGLKSIMEPQVKRILLVDDDPFNLEFHTQIIKSLGYECIETAIDGQRLFEQFKKRPEGYYDAVFTDISMPILDGMSAAKLIRKFEEDEKRSTKVKIGFITGHPNQRDKLICEKAPLNCLFYLSKPIKPAMIESFLPSMTEDPSRLRFSCPNKAFSNNILSSSGFKENLLPSVSLQLSSPLVLCVDDDLFNLDFLEEMLRSLEVRTVKATSGEESLAIMKNAFRENVKERIPRLVLMDCRMPRMDGWTASKMMKEMLRGEFGADVAIIGVSGDDKRLNQEKLRLSGMNELLQKPIQREELQSLIRKYIN